MENDFVLYLLPRKDMASLNHAGKVLAQAAHAANHAAHDIGKGLHGSKPMQDFAEWERQTPQGFGTTIVLGSITHRTRVGQEIVTLPLRLRDITEVVESVKNFGIAAGVTKDPSYPLEDGNTLHAFPCETCGWIFGSKSTLAGILSNFHLHSADPASV